MRVEKAAFPRTISHEKIRTLTVKIYRAANDGKDEYTLIYYNGNGERKRIASRDLAALEARAGEILDDLAGGRKPDEAEALSAHERQEYAQMRAILAEVGALPLTVARQHVEAMKMLGGDLVLEAVRFYVRRNMHKAQPIALDKVKEELITAKRARGKSELYLSDLEYRLGRFCGALKNMNVADVQQKDIQAFLDGLGLSGRSYNNFRRSLLSLFNFAVSRKYLAKDWDEMDGIEANEDAGGEITIYTPDEIAKLLAACDEPKHTPLIAFLALGAFGGLRSAEISRLDWSAINFETGHITLAARYTDDAGKIRRLTKTGSRRIVPLLPAAKAWLEPIRQKAGRVWDFGHTYQYELLHGKRKTPGILKKAGVAYKANALRHSFISYRLAETQNINQVALEAGNSAGMIHAHYKELVTQAQAKAWFAVMPATPENVVESGIAKAA